MTQLTPQWQDWIELNLARQCSPESIVEQMVRGNFDLAAARRAVNSAVAKGSAETMAESFSASQDNYVYGESRLPHGNVISTSDRKVKVVLRMQQPAIAVLEGVLSDEECDELVRRSIDKLQRSTTIDANTGQQTVISERTSEGTYFAINADSFIATLDKRIAELMGKPVEHGEGLQILHYLQGGEYRPHFDFFDLDHAGSHVHLRKGGQRVSTLIMYLSDVVEGGGTSFPKLGLEIKPKKGSAVYFEYANSLGQLDELTLHAGEPVLQGEKWIMTKWMRQRRFCEPDTAVETQLKAS
jgi:prolyl 4-hydroxylase